MNAAAPLLGAIDGVTPVVLIEQRVQGVLVTSDRVGLVQGQPRSFGRFDKLRDRRRGALLPDGRRRVLPPPALLWGGMRIPSLSALHRSCSFLPCERRSSFSSSPSPLPRA